jgi:hypothetical protein
MKKKHFLAAWFPDLPAINATVFSILYRPVQNFQY